jgi:hypothetical protein
LLYGGLGGLGSHRIVQGPAQPVGQGAIVEDACSIAPVLEGQGKQFVPLVGRLAIGEGQRPQRPGLAGQIGLEPFSKFGRSEPVVDLLGQGGAQHIGHRWRDAAALQEGILHRMVAWIVVGQEVIGSGASE